MNDFHIRRNNRLLINTCDKKIEEIGLNMFVNMTDTDKYVTRLEKKRKKEWAAKGFRFLQKKNQQS